MKGVWCLLAALGATGGAWAASVEPVAANRVSATGARTAPFTVISTLASFDRLYIPALFLSGQAGKGAEAALRADASLQRLQAVWPTQQHALRAVAPGQTVWLRAIDRVDGHFAQARREADAGTWPEAHATLERVRETMFEARQRLSLAYELDAYTAYHPRMEALADVREVKRAEMLQRHAEARRLWVRIATGPADPQAFGLTEDQLQRLRQAQAAESQALEALEQALRHGSDAEVREAAKALKPPFVKAYVAFGRGAEL